MSVTSSEQARRDEVLARVIRCVQEDQRIVLPPLGEICEPGEFALHRLPPNEFSGEIGAYVYQFEGEEDLLHLIVARKDGAQLSPEEGQSVAAFALPGVAPGLIWLRPGTQSQHFYLAHDLLLSNASV